MPIVGGIPQVEPFSITPLLQAWEAGTQARYQQEDRAAAEEARMEETISRLAYSADTPEKWERFVSALERRYPQADLSQYRDFSTREMAIGMGLSVPEQFNMDMANRQWDQGQSDRARADAEAAALRTGLTTLVEGQPVPATDGGRGNGSWMLAGAGPDQAPQVYRDAIASIESDGSGGYQAVGPVANESGDRAYGRYQVMGANVGPWTQEVLGRAMTPEEFLASPEAQDAVFDAKFGGYIRQFGSPQAAAQAWFGGPGSVGQGGGGTDVLGTSGNEYIQRFNRAIGMSSQGGVPLTDQQRTLVHALIDGGQVGEALQIITAAMQPPEPGEPFTLADGAERRDAAGNLIARNEPDPPAPGAQFGPIVTGDAARIQNLDPTKSWQQRLDTGEWQQVGGGGVNVAVDTAASQRNAVVEGMFGDILTEGRSAMGDIALLGRLEGLLDTTGGGMGTALQQFAGQLGLEIGDGVPEIQAAQAIINYLVPRQRVPGSGVTTDFDARMFIGSLPQLINTPDGNRLILETMRGLAAFKAEQAAIALRYLTEETNPATGSPWTASESLNAIFALPDPFEAFKASPAGAAAAGGATQPTTAAPATDGIAYPTQPAPPATAAPTAPFAPVDIPTVHNAAEYEALAPGTQYYDPQGNLRTKR